MVKRGRSFFERLTGAVGVDEYDDDIQSGSFGSDDDVEKLTIQTDDSGQYSDNEQSWVEEENNEGQLTVDVFNTPNEIVIKAIVAGVKPEDLDISITRDMVTIRGKREEHKEVVEEDYFYRELYWGTFSRTVLLPQEIEVEEATATEKHGLLSIRLPKIDKEKQTKLKVRTG